MKDGKGSGPRAGAQASRAMSIHRTAWENVLSRAGDGTYEKYGLYGSRVLTVCHPEVYLRGDALFWRIARRVDGFQEAYETEDVTSPYLMNFPDLVLAGQNAGRPLSMNRVDRAAYRVIAHPQCYPQGYPVFPWLDLRMLPLAVTLKDKERRLTAIERAEHEYFRAVEAGAPADALFLVLCANGEAYLYRPGQLWDARAAHAVQRANGQPVLIFNEQTAWYPLMGRDDRRHSVALARAVQALSATPDAPELKPWEAAQAAALRQVTRLDHAKQSELAMLVAAGAHGWGRHAVDERWDRLLPHQEYDPWTLSRRMGVLRECFRYASHLSPAAAWLACLVLQGADQEAGIRALGKEYLRNVGVPRDDARGWKQPGRWEAWGHLWGCGLLEYTIDSVYRARGAHCIGQAVSTSAALDLAGVEHYVLHFNRGGVNSRDHHLVYSIDGEFVIDDGIVNFFAKDHPTATRWASLLSFSRAGQWAGTVVGQFYGNLLAHQTIAAIHEIERVIGGKFTMQFLSLLRDGKEQLCVDEFISYLQALDNWQPVTLP